MSKLKAITVEQGDWLNESGEPQIIEHHESTGSFLEGHVRKLAEPKSVSEELAEIISVLEKIEVTTLDENYKLVDVLVKLHCIKLRHDFKGQSKPAA